MPTPRRSRSTTPASTPNQKTRASSRTPTTVHHHHKTADELAAEEAASLLTPTTARLRSNGSTSSSTTDILDGGSARALRHRRLNEVREEGEAHKEKEEERSTASQESKEEKTDDDEDADVGAASAAIVLGDLNDGESNSNTEATTTEKPSSTRSSIGDVFALQQEQVVAESSASGSDSDPDSESDEDASTSSSGSSSESDSETDETDADEEDERMERLLQAAKAAAIAKASSSGKGKEKVSEQQEEEDETVLQFDEDQKEKKKDAPIPDLSIPGLPKPHLTFTQDGRASASTQLPSTSQAGPSKRPLEGRKAQKAIAVPELDDRPYERELSKREKAAQPRKATTSELWATIPTPRSDLLPQMKKDYQALALANSLDPKRFMKGGSRSDKVPESFAIGTMVDAPRHLQATTLMKERKYRAGEVVQGLIKDDSTGDYAKRKYGDLQWSKMENGRGKGWKKRSKW